jgi:hypothetical protein
MVAATEKEKKMQRPTGNVESTGERIAELSLERVRTGMKVVDAAGHDIGKVAFVKMSDPVAETEEAETDRYHGEVIAAPSPSLGDSSGRPMVAMPVGPANNEIEEEVPEPIRARLLRKGYLRIDGALLFGKDRYVFGDQIASVGDDVVKLNVNQDALPVRE